MNNWPGLIAMAVVLVIAMSLVAWAAFTLGDMPRPMPRRPLPYPRGVRHPRHARGKQTIEQAERVRLIGPYVVALELERARRYR